MISIIITGATGFVGTNLQQSFEEENIPVYPISLRETNWEDRLPKKGTAIIHLAGKAHDTSNNADLDSYFKINRDLTIDLFKVYIESEIKDFFYFSSVKAVADTLDEVLTEDMIADPRTAYGKSKFETEEYLKAQILPQGKRLFIIRPCMIHGPGNKGNLNLLYNIVEKGIPWPLGKFENRRSFLGINNLCYLIKEMVKREDISSDLFNFADDDTLSTTSVVQLIGECLGKPATILYLNAFVVRILVKIGDILPLPLNSERLKKLTESYVVSNAKIKRILDIKSLPMDAEEGLEKTISSFIKQSAG